MTSYPASREHEERYRMLVAQYVDSFPEKLDTLARAISAGRQGDSKGLAEAREIAHRMHGTAGCYGLRELSAKAAVLDDILTRMKRGEGGTWPEADEAAKSVYEVARAAVESRKAG